MTVLVTGSAGHLGEALVRALRAAGRAVRGLDLRPSPHTDHVGSIVDRAFVERCLDGIDAVVHAATLHKPHVATATRQAFVDTNVTGTLNLLEGAAARRMSAFVFTSTTSTFGDALVPPPGAPAAWITEDVAPVPKNVYGVTKTAAEDLCRLFARNERLPVTVLRTSRFFLEADDDPRVRDVYDDANLKVNELLHRRTDFEDMVSAHVAALERPPDGFARYVISAPTPFRPEDAAELRVDAPAVLARRVPGWREVYGPRGWRMFPTLDRVYDSALALRELPWRPRWDFPAALDRLRAGDDFRSPLARSVGVKGYVGGGGEYPPASPGSEAQEP